MLRCDLTICNSHHIRKQSFLPLCLKILTQELKGGRGSQPTGVSILTISDVPGIGLDSSGCNQVFQRCLGHGRQDTTIRERMVVTIRSPTGDEICRNMPCSHVPSPRPPSLQSMGRIFSSFSCAWNDFRK